MAENSDSDPLNPNQASPAISASGRRSTMPGIKRLTITLSVLFPFLIALPFLFKSTEIYRAPLPFTSINSLSSRLLPEPPSPPCHLQIVFLGSNSGDSSADQLARLISEEVDKRNKSSACGSCGRNYVVSVVVDAGSGGCARSGNSFWKCGEVGLRGLRNDDEFVDEMLREAVGRGGKSYSVVVGERDEKKVRVVVGKYRHAWVKGNVAVSLIADVFVKYFVNGGREEEEDGARRKGEFVPVGLDGSLVLSFSLLNAKPDDWVYEWYG